MITQLGYLAGFTALLYVARKRPHEDVNPKDQTETSIGDRDHVEEVDKPSVLSPVSPSPSAKPDPEVGQGRNQSNQNEGPGPSKTGSAHALGQEDRPMPSAEWSEVPVPAHATGDATGYVHGVFDGGWGAGLDPYVPSGRGMGRDISGWHQDTWNTAYPDPDSTTREAETSDLVTVVPDRWQGRAPPPHYETGLESRIARAVFVPERERERHQAEDASSPKKRDKGRKGKGKEILTLYCQQCDRKFGDETALGQDQGQGQGPSASANGNARFRSSKSPSPGSSSMMSSSGWTLASGSEAAVTCEVCSEPFKTRYALRQHKTQEHEWAIFCKTCFQTFQHASEAQLHYVHKHGAAQGISPHRIQELVNHVRETPVDDPQAYLPPNQRIYPCNRCGLEFLSRRDLLQHSVDPVAHSSGDAFSPNFPPLTLALPPDSIDLDQPLPSFSQSSEQEHERDLSVVPGTNRNVRVFDPVNPTFGRGRGGISGEQDDEVAEYQPSHVRTYSYGVIGGTIVSPSVPLVKLPPFPSASGPKVDINIDTLTATGVVAYDPETEPSSESTLSDSSEPATPSDSVLLPPRPDPAVPVPVPEPKVVVYSDKDLKGEIYFQLPSFQPSLPDEDFAPFVQKPPGPLPAPPKATALSAWSIPISSTHPGEVAGGGTTTESFSIPGSGTQSPPSDATRLIAAFTAQHRASHVPIPRAATQRPGSGAGAGARRPHRRGGRRHNKNGKHGNDQEEEEEPPIPRLEPRYETNEWITLDTRPRPPAPSPSEVGNAYAYANPNLRNRVTTYDSWEGEDGGSFAHAHAYTTRAHVSEPHEVEQVRQAYLAAGEEDPFGGW